MKWLISMMFITILTGCSSKPPDLEAPCHNFGQYCVQYPINEEPTEEYVK